MAYTSEVAKRNAQNAKKTKPRQSTLDKSARVKAAMERRAKRTGNTKRTYND